MSETPAETAPPGDSEAPAPPAAETLDFDRAEFEEPKGEHVECGLCKRTIHTEYWQALGKILCASCKKTMERTAEEANGGKAFAKALLRGGAVAFACGVGYAIFVGVTDIQFALVTIGIGWAVGTTLQKVTRGFGGRKHQILAVALTYFASTMCYFPGIIKGFREVAEERHTTAAGAPSAAAPAPADAPVTTTPADAPSAPATTGAAPTPSRMNVGVALLIFTAISVALMLASPFLVLGSGSGVSGLLGLLIIFFGLRTAWRISRGVQATITGPHQVGASDAA